MKTLFKRIWKVEFPHIWIMILILCLGYASAGFAQDQCEFFSDKDQRGERVNYLLPDSNVAGQSWSNVSRRFEGANLKVHAHAIYKNLESVRITAMNSDVTLYVYDGDNFNGKFQAVRVKKGNVGTWNFGSMRNRVRSIICQRDPRLPASNGVSALLTGFPKNHMIPTSLLADSITATVHDAVKSQRKRFYHHRLDIKQGRIIWETGLEECRAVKCVSIQNDWRRKYWDFLRYSYKASGRLKADGKIYTISIDIWIEPFLDSNGNIRFRGDAFKVSVSKWIWHNVIRKAVESNVRQMFPTIGQAIELGLRSTVRNALGQSGVNLLSNNDRLVFSYSCNSALDRVGYPNYNYTAFQVQDICGGETPDSVVAPGLRLLRK
jgi:hypothetical protein